MIRKISYLILLSLLVAAFLAMSAMASSVRVDRRVIDPTINKAQYYSFPDEHQRPIGTSGESSMRLGESKSTSYTASPGLVIGHTWYDYQRNGSMKRMVGWGSGLDPDNPSDSLFVVHFNWMHLLPPIAENRAYAYQAWVEDITTHTGAYRNPGDGIQVQPNGDWSGYVGLDVDKSNRAVLYGHWDAGHAGHFRSAFWLDRVPAGAFFATASVPDAQQEYTGAGPTSCAGQEVIWPAAVYQEGPTDTVLHVVGSVSDVDSQCATATQSIYYFRKVGARNPGSLGIIPGTWDFPPYVVDTNFTLSHDIFASKHTAKVVMAWIAARPDPGDCDTCSSNTGGNSLGNSQLDNDIYIQTSMDQGATWLPRYNLTKRPHPDSVSEATYGPYIDLSLLLDDDDDETHLTWNGHLYEPGTGSYGLLACRLFVWNEFTPGGAYTMVNDYGPGGIPDGKERGVIRTAHTAVWDQTTCNGGAWQLNISKMTMSQCNGKHYIVFVQFNDIPNGIENDCAARAFTGGGGGAANGELWVVVSDDNGITWDKARNITKSFSGGDASTACHGTTTDDCQSDHWPSTAPYGAPYSASTPSSNIIVPDGGSDPGEYIDMMWVDDPDAGGVAQAEGTWQEADMHWARIACVEPVPAPNPVYSFEKIAFPSCSKHGQDTTRNLTIENAGNVSWGFTVAKFEAAGPYPGWLTFANFTSPLPSGLSNVETGQVTLNTGGIVNSPGTIVSLQGGLIFTSTTGPAQVDTIPIVHTVADTCVPPTVDTISNNIFSLVVGSNGNFGNAGDGGVNMDFVYSDTTGPDCDSANDVVLYDGSPFVMWVSGTDTVANWSIFGDSWLSERGFRPRVGKHKFESYLYECYSTGVFSTNDSSLFLEKTWYSPRNYGGNDQGFFVECVKLWSADGNPHANLTVGEAVDWDIPSDSGVDNSTGFKYTAPSGSTPAFNLIYMQGANYVDGDTGAVQCQPNDMRYGGVEARGTFVNGNILSSGNIYNAITLDNPTYVLPEGTYLPQQLYNKIDTTTGFEKWTPISGSPDSEYVDLNMVITNLHGYNLGATDTLTMYYVFSASINTDAASPVSGEFLDWINAGIDFDVARVCYADWRYPTHIAYQATSVVVAGDVTGGTSPSGASKSYNAGTNATTLSGSSPIEFVAADGDQLIVTSVDNGGPVAFHQVRWLTAATPTNPNGGDTIVFMDRGEGNGHAKASLYSWYKGAAMATGLAAHFANPASGTGLSAFSTFIQSTTNLSDYTGWSPNVPSGNDLGVPRTVNQTLIDTAGVTGNWLYVKTTTDGGGGPYASGAQIDGFQISFGCCVSRGDANHSGGNPDIADVTYLVAYAFKGGPVPPCLEEGDVNASGGNPDIADVTYLVAYAFKGGTPPPACN